MRLIGITVCVNYTDYLSHTIESVLATVDEHHIITSPQDIETINFCSDKSVKLKKYYGFHKRAPNMLPARFNKAGAIRELQSELYLKHGLCYLGEESESDTWFLLIDADILLPDNARKVIEDQAKNMHTLYGAKRVDYATREQFLRGVGTSYRHDYAGYFQLYNRPFHYPDYSSNCGRCDVIFYKQFRKRKVLDMTVSHLGQDHVNWNGRVSSVW